MSNKVFNYLGNLDGILVATAHCDIPCKIYDPIIGQIAALSVVRLMDILNDVPVDSPASKADQNTIFRCILRKEEEAEKVKHEVGVIWGDYFKVPQFEQFPKASELVHGIMQKASACKQGVDRNDGEELLNLVNEFAKMFWESKGVSTMLRESPYPPNLMVVYPEL